MRSPALLGALLASLSLPACLLFLDTERNQCATDQDCMNRGGGFTNMKCEVATGLCRAPDAPQTQNSGTDANVDVDASDAAKIPCKTTAECPSTPGAEQICNKISGDCVAVKTPECPYILGDSKNLQSDDLVLFGGFSNITAAAPLSDPVVVSYKLALDEIGGVPGLPPGSASPNRRPVSMLLCNADPTKIDAASDHLINDLKVPGAVGYFSQTNTTRLFQDKYNPAGVFLVNPGGTTVALRDNPGNKGLIWHLLGPPENLTAAYIATLAREEAFYRSENSIPTAPLRVAVIVSQNDQDLAAADGFATGLMWNGKNVTDNGKNYLQQNVESIEKTPTADYATYVADLLGFKPHIIIAITAGEFEAKMFGAMEAQWGTSAPQPAIIIGHRAPLQPYIDDVQSVSGIGARKTRARRFVGVQYAAAPDRTEYNLYINRMIASYPDVKGIESTENYYDAVYWLAYGAAGAGLVGPLVGEDVGKGVRNLLDGPQTITTGALAVAKGFSAIAVDSKATFLGVSGPPNFDPIKGYRTSVGATFCLDVSGATANASPLYDTLRYNPATSKLEPSFNPFCYLTF
jgi:hypothetical protein